MLEDNGRRKVKCHISKTRIYRKIQSRSNEICLIRTRRSSHLTAEFPPQQSMRVTRVSFERDMLGSNEISFLAIKKFPKESHLASDLTFDSTRGIGRGIADVACLPDTWHTGVACDMWRPIMFG